MRKYKKRSCVLCFSRVSRISHDHYHDKKTRVVLSFIAGAVIGLEINGDKCVKVCNQILNTMFEGKNQFEHAFISRSKETAAKNIDDFYNFVDMTMS